MAISQSDMIAYFDIFGLGVNASDSGSLECFKCGNVLSYVNKSVWYRCVNGHSYDPHSMVINHAENMASIVEHLYLQKICGVQLEN